MKRIKLYFLLTITLILISVSLATTLQFFKGYVIDGLASLNNQNTIMRDLFILCIMIALEILFTALADYNRNKFIYMKEIELKRQMFHKILNMRIHNFMTKEYSHYVNELTTKTNMVIQKYYQRLIILFWLGFRIVFVICALIRVDPILSIIITFLMLIPIVIPKLLSKKLRVWQKNELDSENKFLKYCNNYLRLFETIKLFSVEQVFANKFSKIAKNNSTTKLKNNNIKTFSEILSMIFSYYIYFIALAYSVLLIYKRHLPIGILITVLGLVEQLSWPAIEIANVVRDLHTTNCIKKDFYTNKVTLTDFQNESNNNENIQNILPDIKFSNVSFSYETKNILNNFNYCFKAKKKYLILGESGKGKTTLLKLILDYYSPHKGKVSFEPDTNVNIYKLSSIVRQNEELFIDSLYFNLTLGKDIPEEEVKKVLEKLNLDYLYYNENFKIANNSISLSGGELRRVILARALLLDKRVIILDEPLAGLDDSTRKQVEDIICDLSNVTLIVVSHVFSKEKMNNFDGIIHL